MTFQIQKFWKQIRIGDIRASSLAFINGVEHPSVEILYSHSRPLSGFLCL